MSLLRRKLGDRFTGNGNAIDGANVPVGQRVRVGLTGLAAIFLLILVATAGLRPTVSMATPPQVDEPLALLGVAPGAGPATETAAAPRSRPART